MLNQRKWGSVLSYLGVLLNIFVSLLLSPFTVNALGRAQYGLYQLIWSFVGFMGVLDLGFTSSTVRYIAKYRAQGNKAGQRQYLSMAMVIYGIITLCILGLGAVLYAFLGQIFPNLEPGQLALAKKLFVVMIINFSVNILLNIFPAVCDGYERFVFNKGLAIFRVALRSVLVVLLLSGGGGAMSLAVLDTVISLVVLIVQAFYVTFRLGVSMRPSRFSCALFKEVFPIRSLFSLARWWTKLTGRWISLSSACAWTRTA